MLADRIDSWFQQWEHQGMQKGESRFLLQLIRHRFGPDLPSWVGTRLQSARPEQLERWGLALLTANTLTEVFGNESE